MVVEQHANRAGRELGQPQRGHENPLRVRLQDATELSQKGLLAICRLPRVVQKTQEVRESCDGARRVKRWPSE